MRARAGFTLTEVLVCLILGTGLVVLTGALLERVLWQTRSRADRAAIATTLGTGVGFLDHELAQLGTDSLSGVDVQWVGAGLGFRGQRALRYACDLRQDTIVVVADTAWDWSVRAPVPGRDSLLLYAPGDSTQPVDAWLPLPLLGAAPRACPGGAAGLMLVTALDSATLGWGGFPPLAPVRIFETLDAQPYPSGFGWQLGVRRASAAGLQPLTGPLAPAGLDVTGLDRAGLPTTVVANMTALVVALRARAARLASSGLGARGALADDSARVEIPMRNVRP